MASSSTSGTSGPTLQGFLGYHAIVREIRSMVINPLSQVDLGECAPFGLLIHGPTGCGKSCLVKALSSEVSVPVLNLNVCAENIIEHVQHMFEDATNSAPSILVIENIDVLGSITYSYQDETSNLAIQMFLRCWKKLMATGKFVVVIGTTYVIDDLDPFVRLKFEKKLHLNYPDQESRIEMLTELLSDYTFDGPLDFSMLCNSSSGFSGREIVNLCEQIGRSVVRNVYKKERYEIAARIGETTDAEIWKQMRKEQCEVTDADMIISLVDVERVLKTMQDTVRARRS